jgi:hypothetical protein
MHVHVFSGDGEAKYWLEPEVKLARNHGFSKVQLGQIVQMIEAHYDELRSAWQKYFRA